MRKNISIIILLLISLSLLNTSNGWAWWPWRIKLDCRNSTRSPDGKKIACKVDGFVFSDLFNPGGGQYMEDLYVMNIDRSHKKRIAKNIYHYAWSPDGKRIAYESFEHKGHGQRDIYIVDANGRHRKRLTKNTWDDTDPTWTPDGKKIAFLSREKERGGRKGLFTINPDGSDKRFLTKGSWPYVWSPDGEKIAFTGDRAIVIKNPDGTDRKEIDVKSLNEDYTLNIPHWSPDGKWVAISASYRQRQPPKRSAYDILLVDRDGNNLKKLVIAFNGEYYWADSNRIIYNDQGYAYPTEIEDARPELTGIFTINIDGTGKKKIRQSWGEEDYEKICR